ncbi:MAG: carboxypeptidase regulatory-like domain-containing protein [Candidatus Omnitrophica bacterium]|nr:carboxypeptidase regulatory-like domain-containing protein [Candidatus Omnitrophota bacterium]
MCVLVVARGPLAEAFGLERQPVRWKREAGRPIEFTVNMAQVPNTLPQDRYVAFVKKALEAWQQVETADVPFAVAGIITDEAKTEPQADGVNTVFWKPGFVPRDQFAGKAYPFPSECDILLAPKPPFTLLDVQGIVMHELGHCLGLAHSTAPGVMKKFTGLPALGYDDRVAVSLLYPNHRRPLEEATAVLRGRVVDHDGDPLTGAILQVLDGKTGNLILAGFSGLVNAQRRPDPSGQFELPGIPPGRHRLRIQPMDAFSAADPPGYGAPAGPPRSFAPRVIDLPELGAGEAKDIGKLAVEDS